MTTFTVEYFVGGPARGSTEPKLASALVRRAPRELQMREIPELLTGFMRELHGHIERVCTAPPRSKAERAVDPG